MKTQHLLLDTHTLLWLDNDLSQFSQETLRLLYDTEHIYFSSASAWELSIKQSIGKINLRRPVSEAVRQHGFLELPVTVEYAEVAAKLPLHHKDPFDRMIVAQAIQERLTLVTADKRLANYPVSILQA